MKGSVILALQVTVVLVVMGLMRSAIIPGINRPMLHHKMSNVAVHHCYLLDVQSFVVTHRTTLNMYHG